MSASEAAQTGPQKSPPQESAKGSPQKSLLAAPVVQAFAGEGAPQDMDENETGTGLLLSADPDISGGSVSYSIVGGAHGDLFTIDALTNELKFINEPDYEAPVSAYESGSVVRYNTNTNEHTIEQSPNVITEDPATSTGTAGDGYLESGEDVLLDGEAGQTYVGKITIGGHEMVVTKFEQDGTTYIDVLVPQGVDPQTLNLPTGLSEASIPRDSFDLPETNDYQVVVEANEGGRTSTQTITITVEDVVEGSALPLSGFSLSTVKLDAELLDDLEGTVVSTPTDPAAPQALPKLPAIDWVDDGFVAAQMQLDMSDALDGF